MIVLTWWVWACLDPLSVVNRDVKNNRSLVKIKQNIMEKDAISVRKSREMDRFRNVHVSIDRE